MIVEIDVRWVKSQVASLGHMRVKCGKNLKIY